MQCGFENAVAIVDDDASAREALARLFRARGINSRSYPSALAFLDALSREIPCCLILDVQMPDMTGLELQRELVSRGLRIPTVLITGNFDETIAATAASLGTACLRKPVAQVALMTALRSAMESKIS
jgi:FixJ family two-component response regulator